jgi:hypothetical protein
MPMLSVMIEINRIWALPQFDGNHGAGPAVAAGEYGTAFPQRPSA